MSATKDYSAEQLIQFFSEKKSEWWEKEGQKRALALFHDAAVRVPAYKDHLKKNGIKDHTKVKTWEDFRSVPLTSKKDYLRQYPLEKLCWDGNLNKQLVFTATSGSTGQPFYFPRTERLDWQMSVTVESFLKNNGQKIKGPILVIDAFGMGVWIGGLITYKGFEMAAARGGYPISIITPGINKEEIFKALKNIAPHFEEVIFGGYPPFVKDIVDEAPERGIDLKKMKMRFIFAAEPFGEKFREYIAERAGVKNMYIDNLHVYGTADIGTMAWETPTTILTKRLALKSNTLFSDLFGEIQKTPTLAQYNPREHLFEETDGRLLVTGNSAVPLIRYDLGDNGGVMTYDTATKAVKMAGIDLEKETKKAGIKQLYRLPMVYVYERSDFSTKLYGAIIYPEHVREGVFHPKVKDFLTGKFTMITQFDKDHNEFLEIHYELKSNVKPSEKLKKFVEEGVVKNFLEKNAEYRNNYNSIPDRVRPRIIFWENGHELYFRAGGKQKWIKK